MVVAHLRGLLKPNHPYGRRSALAEDVVLEGLLAENMVKELERDIDLDQAVLPLLEVEASKKTLKSCVRKLARMSELANFDVYRVGEQILGEKKIAAASEEVSMLRLYEFAEKKGIIDKAIKHQSGKPKRPLLSSGQTKI